VIYTRQDQLALQAADTVGSVFTESIARYMAVELQLLLVSMPELDIDNCKMVCLTSCQAEGSCEERNGITCFTLHLVEWQKTCPPIHKWLALSTQFS
jgi:hypothetical protein